MIEASKRDRASLSPVRRVYLALELAVVFVGFPVYLYFIRMEFREWIIPTLLATAGVCLVVLLRDPHFDRRRLWNRSDFGRHLRRSVLVFLPAAGLLTLAVLFLVPERFLQLPKERPGLWVLVLVLYPLLSVYPQEIIFRTFFFHRYAALLPRPSTLIFASGLVFGLAHLFFGNWLAPLLTTLGGFLFASTYQRSDSTLQAFLEHSLWGDFLFTVGLGWYFYGGSIVLMAG